MVAERSQVYFQIVLSALMLCQTGHTTKCASNQQDTRTTSIFSEGGMGLKMLCFITSAPCQLQQS